MLVLPKRFHRTSSRQPTLKLLDLYFFSIPSLVQGISPILPTNTTSLTKDYIMTLSTSAEDLTSGVSSTEIRKEGVLTRNKCRSVTLVIFYLCILIKIK